MLRLIFALLLLLHGAIHLMGFVKAFKYAEVSQLGADISRPAGIGWLSAALLLGGSAVLFILKKDVWWLPAAVGLLVSQVMIFSAWKEAKFGAVANLIMLVGALPAYGAWRFNAMIRSELTAFQSAASAPAEVVADSQLAPLPPIVQAWLRNSGVVGKPMTQAAQLVQTGRMRTTPDGAWMPVTARQFFRTSPPGFYWTADVHAAPLISLAGRDRLQDGHGHMLIKALSLYPVADAHGPQTDQGTLLRYLAEICWFPDAALQPYIRWTAVDSLTANATLKSVEMNVTGTFHFSPNGELRGFDALRYYEQKGGATLEKWHIENDPASYRVFEGRRIPTRSAVSWQLEGENFTWFELEIDQVHYE